MPRPTLLLLACLAAISAAVSACSTLAGPGPGLASPTPAEQSPDH